MSAAFAALIGLIVAAWAIVLSIDILHGVAGGSR